MLEVATSLKKEKEEQRKGKRRRKMRRRKRRQRTYWKQEPWDPSCLLLLTPPVCGYIEWELQTWAIQNIKMSLISYRLNI